MYAKYAKTIQRLDVYIQKGVFPGYSVAFIDGERVQTIVKGQAQVDPTSERLQDGLYYDLASVSKVFVTITLLAQLIEQQKLDLDWSVARFFPQAREQHVTLRHLVTHTSGLAGFIPNRNQLSAHQLVEALLNLSCGPTFNTVHYTDTGFVLAGKVIEKIIDQPLATIFAERVARPLGLEQMTYGPLPAKQCVPTEWSKERGGLIRGTVHDPKAAILKQSCGSAGLFATLADTITYTQMLLNGGIGNNGTRILKEETIDALYADWTPTRQAKRSLGWDLQMKNGTTWLRHTGFTGTAVLWNRPTQQAFILLSNRIHTFPNTAQYNLFRDDLIDIFLTEATS